MVDLKVNMLIENIGHRQLVQEEQYLYPYHYIPTYENGYFSQHQYWSWGYSYIGAMQLLLDKLRSIKFDSLIDIGCGDGRLLREVRKKFPGKRILGVDYSQQAIALAQAMNPNIKYERKDITVESLEDRFDVATLVEVLEHIPPEQLKRFLDGVANTLERGGYLLLTVPHQNKRLQNKHYQHFTSEKIENLLNPFFKVKEAVFFDKRSKLIRLLNLLFGNDIFILNNKHLLTALFNCYRRYFFYATEEKCGRILMMCEKSEECKYNAYEENCKKHATC